MKFKVFGNQQGRSLMLIHGLGVSYEIFLPLIRLLEPDYRIIAAMIDGFLLDESSEAVPSSFTSVYDQAGQIIDYVNDTCGGHLDCAYGLSLGGHILARVLERGELDISHSIMDGAPLTALPRWFSYICRHYQCLNVWCCVKANKFYKLIFRRSHYFHVLLDEVMKVWPSGKGKAVLSAYESVYSASVQSVVGKDVHFWYGEREAFVAKPMVRHLLSICPDAAIVEFPGMQHGQFLVDRPEEIALMIRDIVTYRL